MRKKTIEEIISSQKQKITSELLYLRNKNKGVTKNFIDLLISQNQTTALELLNRAKSKEDFHQLIKQNYHQLINKYGSIFECILTGEAYGIYDASLNLTPAKEGEAFLRHDHKKSALKQAIYQNSKALTDYINKHNTLKHQLLPVENVNGNPIIDINHNFTEDELKSLFDLLFEPESDWSNFSKKDLSTFIVMLLSVYDKDTLLNNGELLSFELEYGYYDEYNKMILEGQELPSLQERMHTLNKEKDLTSQQHYRLSQIDLLEKRISSLKAKSKDLMLEKIKLIRQEPDLQKQAQLIDECFEYYEKNYRQEIVDSLYSPQASTEITDFRDLETVMIHVFIRKADIKLLPYEKSLKEEILSRRGVKVTGTEELTEEEQREYQEKVDYAINVLLNPVVTSESLEGESIYSDSTGFRWYRSDTSNQLSTSVLGMEQIMRQGNCVGVGFDKTSISPENIIISSKYYQTTNMGVNNLEIEPSDQFNSLSSSLEELKSAGKTEVVMFRKNGNIRTNAAYVFAIINGYSEEKDQETIQQAKEYAEKNHIKLIVFNNYKIRKSYNEFWQNEQCTEEQKQEQQTRKR